MAPLPRLFARDEQLNNSSNATTKLLIVLLVLVLVSIFSAVALFVFRRRRRAAAAAAVQAGTFNEKNTGSETSRRISNGFGLFTGSRKCKCKRQSLFVYQEKRDLLNDSSSPPPSPLPEIRITFPEEIDDTGKRQSGRVVVVHVGEKGIGMEPAAEENLPPYQKDVSDRFQSLDLERIGGLKERESTS